MKTQTSPIHGYLYALGATALWSGNFIMARGINGQVPPFGLSFFRWLTAVVFFAPFALGAVKREWEAIRQNLGYLSLVAFTGVSCFNSFIYIASHTTSAMNLALISISSPIFILILSRMLYCHALTFKKLAVVTLVMAGILAILSKGNLETLRHVSFVTEDLWVLAAAILFAVYSLLLKKKPRGMDLVALQFTTFFLGLVFLIPFFLWEQISVPCDYLTPQSMGTFLYMGIFASLFAFMFWNKAVAISGPDRAGMLYYTMPLFCGALGHTFLGEPVGWVHLVSLVLIVGGILLTNGEQANQKNKIYRD